MLDHFGHDDQVVEHFGLREARREIDLREPDAMFVQDGGVAGIDVSDVAPQIQQKAA